MAENPETTLEELTRVRWELQATRRALIALCLADDAHKTALKKLMSAPLHQAIDECENEDRATFRLKEAVALCVELGRSMLDYLTVADCPKCGGSGVLTQEDMDGRTTHSGPCTACGGSGEA